MYPDCLNDHGLTEELLCPSMKEIQGAIDDLKLPQRSCASYMRKEELRTICDAQKATISCELPTKQLHLNTNDNNKKPKKIGEAVANNLVLSINKLEDGTFVAAIKDISREFEKLRHAATW